MSFLEYRIQHTPSGFRKLLYLNWPLVALITAVCAMGWVTLYSIAGGEIAVWASRQIKVFIAGLSMMFIIAFVPIHFWRSISAFAYIAGLILLLMVEFFGTIGMGAQRWLEIGGFRMQPSELMKIALVMMLAAYYDWLNPRKISQPLYVFIPLVLTTIPTVLVLMQPNLGTALILAMVGGSMMILAGVNWWYFIGITSIIIGTLTAVFTTRGSDFQLLHDYQYRRIDTFLDPGSDPLGAGYNITQAKIALGSGGWSGKGFLQGTQSRLNFLPEKHTDFIFTTLGEEFGFVGTFALLLLYALILLFCFISALQSTNRFSTLVILGISVNFFLYIAINLAMVMGLAPVVGVPLPFMSYGGSAMFVLLIAFGLIQSAHIHRSR